MKTATLTVDQLGEVIVRSLTVAEIMRLPKSKHHQEETTFQIIIAGTVAPKLTVRRCYGLMRQHEGKPLLPVLLKILHLSGLTAHYPALARYGLQ